MVMTGGELGNLLRRVGSPTDHGRHFHVVDFPERIQVFDAEGARAGNCQFHAITPLTRQQSG